MYQAKSTERDLLLNKKDEYFIARCSIFSIQMCPPGFMNETCPLMEYQSRLLTATTGISQVVRDSGGGGNVFGTTCLSSKISMGTSANTSRERKTQKKTGDLKQDFAFT